MVAMSQWADQPMNANYIENVLRVGACEHDKMVRELSVRITWRGVLHKSRMGKKQ